MHGNDLLEQWCKEIYKGIEQVRVYKHLETIRNLHDFY